MGIQEGETILDPMAGCGTTAIEASIMGINSIAVELSRFPSLMTRAKVGVLETDCSHFPELLARADRIYHQFAPQGKRTARKRDLFEDLQGGATRTTPETGPVHLGCAMEELMLLCFLDSVGYAARRANRTPGQLFPDLLARYLSAVQAFNESRAQLGLRLGSARVINADARDLPLPDRSVDGILFSPPYSFAIDYVDNDRPQLEFLGVDVRHLKSNMVGLTGSGRTKAERVRSRVKNYFADMQEIMGQCQRVLRSGRYCVLVVGSNTNQTGGVSLEGGLVDIAKGVGLPLEFQIVRQIEGIRNTMRDEFLMFFRKR